MSERAKGIWAMIACCVIWGVGPLFYKLLVEVPPGEVLAHRTLWSLVLFVAIFAVQGRLTEWRRAMTGTHLPMIAVAAVLISLNWLIFIWAVQQGHVVEASLGYYIFPLVAVALGVVVLHERLSRWQALAVALAVAAVVLLTAGLGVAPWVSLGLAFSFGTYGLVKKRLPLGPVISVGAEVTVLAPLAVLWLVMVHLGKAPANPGTGHFGQTPLISLWLILSGGFTAVPLILFSYAARRVELSLLGVLQYINPTLQFFCAVVLFGEAFTYWHMIAFGLIWLALTIYSGATIRSRGRVKPVPLANPPRAYKEG